ncbi:four-carbon acid sugar kinase family protein [Hufsiella ginkgonis]|uniref:Four-carbon acid sugar kinase family protein n=1 Tax=Hufsiella ginkgonis TaxID=2695274 RepID=A0A7K1XW58_9SPHI|nr:four-carbon acid sugar kinase family protein [Hufsiella ginkgonis]MXV15211.1 hypothetical protein [Hufsiella ginkgonis]
MIAVIADDLTGAAEIAGIGLRFGLNVELSMEVPGASHADLLVIATDTRSRSREEAVAISGKTTSALTKLRPQWIYKKIDSVMRGHLLPEIAAQMTAMNCDTALIVPANPHLGRTIKNGRYLVHDTPVNQTGFAHDPDFPVTESDILRRFSQEEHTLQVLSCRGELSGKGIYVGEAASGSDLGAWAGLKSKPGVLAGAAGFFSSLLEHEGLKARINVKAVRFESPSLYVCGSAYKERVDLVRAAFERNSPVSYLPAALTQAVARAGAGVTAWCDEIVSLLNQYGTAIIAIDPAAVEPSATATHLRKVMAAAVARVLRNIPVRELFIEGGSTASAILEEAKITALSPINELAAGVVRMQAAADPGFHITIKPGSYHWPEMVNNFFAKANYTKPII